MPFRSREQNKDFNEARGRQSNEVYFEDMSPQNKNDGRTKPIPIPTNIFYPYKNNKKKSYIEEIRDLPIVKKCFAVSVVIFVFSFIGFFLYKKNQQLRILTQFENKKIETSKVTKQKGRVKKPQSKKNIIRKEPTYLTWKLNGPASSGVSKNKIGCLLTLRTKLDR